MNGYLINFAVYTLAMIGFFILAVYIYKKSMYSTSSKDKSFLNVENMMKLSPTKSIYVIKAGKERFLIAGDSSNTTMLAKLEDSSYIAENNENKE